MTEHTEDLALSTQDIKQFQLAREFLGRFYVLMRLARSHDRYNSAVANAAEALHEITNDLIDEAQVVRFDIADNCVFFNRTRLRASLSGFNTLKYFADEVTARGVSSLSLGEIAEVDDFLSFAMVFARFDRTNDDPFTELDRLVTLEGIAGIEIRPLRGLGEDSDDAGGFSGPTQDEAKRSFFSALHIVRQAVRDGISRGKVNPRKVKRVVESVVDSILSDEQSMLALTAIRDYDEYTYHHSFNVCVYSIAIGNRLGLPRQALSDIGIAALFHDVGKTEVPRDILNKIDNLTDDDWKVIQEHTLSGVKMLTYLKKLDRTILRSMIVAFCHHLNLDRTGYPETTRPIKPDAFSRIVRIADIYDALTSARSYRMKALSASKALAIISGKAGEQLDPTLCAIFADVVGVEPDGHGQRDVEDEDATEYSSVQANPE
ncbi:MAG: HD domain-containing phosphohydrolase [Candidatus Eisenbacteria bacterium]